MNTVPFSNTVITGGFWKEKQDLIRNVTTRAVYDRFCDTGRFDAFRCDWKEGMPNKPHIFWDSDVAKWIEGVAHLAREKREPELEKIVDDTIDLIEKNQWEDGYFNIYYTLFAPDKRFTVKDDHELYCAGHFMEAAVAYYEATGKDKLLKIMCRYTDYIEKRFKIQQDTGFATPGHEEIELALVKLYQCTKEERYLDLARHFVNTRGQEDKDNIADWMLRPYNQSHLPVREQTTAEGHAVRATYLYSGMADLAYLDKDEALKNACEAIFDNITQKRMYITGGIGSGSTGEAFTIDYDLPNIIAYTETCAAIGLIFFANRMLQMDANSKYANVIERALYNGFLASTSLDGKAFYYENPLEYLPYMTTREVSTKSTNLRLPPIERAEVFGCSCCPPNITRFIPSVANLLYTDDGETLYLHQYMDAVTKITRNGKELTVKMETAYPQNGKIRLTVSGGDLKMAMRVPDWCKKKFDNTVKGYTYFTLQDGVALDVEFPMEVRFVRAHALVHANAGKVAVQYGPVVYCSEEADNGAVLRDLRLKRGGKAVVGVHAELGVPTLELEAFRRPVDVNAPLYSDEEEDLIPVTATLIPFYAHTNRGPCEMQIWHLVE